MVAPSSVTITARKSGQNGPCRPTIGKVRISETAGDRTLTQSFGKEQMLLPSALQRDRPALGVGEPNPVQLLQSHHPLPTPATIVPRDDPQTRTHSGVSRRPGTRPDLRLDGPTTFLSFVGLVSRPRSAAPRAP